MKKLFLLCIICCLTGGSYLFWEQEKWKKVEKNFQEVVNPVVTYMKQYPQLDLDFLDDLDTVSHDVKKMPNVYVNELYRDFHESLLVYQKSHPRDLPLLYPIENLVENMSIEEKVAQLFVIGIDASSPDETLRMYIEREQPGGVILMGKNIGAGTLDLVNQLQSTQDSLPLFIGIDQEGGSVKRIPESLPAQSELTREETCDVYSSRSQILSARGVNLNFGLVVDVTDDRSSFIYPRVFRGTEQERAKILTEAIRCSEGVLTTLKHFPGHGATSKDTHSGYATMDRDYDARNVVDLPPFQHGINAGADVIMMGHLIAPFLGDDLPGTLSSAQIAKVRSLGFTGVVITDDLGMLESNYSLDQRVTGALLAGNDLLLIVDPVDGVKAIEHSKQIVSSGEISIDDIDQRVSRLLEKKQKLIKERGTDSYILWDDRFSSDNEGGFLDK